MNIKIEKVENLAKSLKCNLDIIQESVNNAHKIIESMSKKDKAILYTMLHSVMNSIAKELTE